MATKKVLIVVSHPDAVNSFNQKMVKVAQEALKKKGFEVRVNNLVASQFSPYAGKPDFKELKNKDKFDYQLEQKVALEKGTFIDEIKKQQDDLVWCDYVIHQFPFYWFSIPGLHKAWVDRVLSYHFAYGQDHAHLKGKKWLTAVTTGTHPLNEAASSHLLDHRRIFFCTLTNFFASAQRESVKYLVFGASALIFAFIFPGSRCNQRRTRSHVHKGRSLGWNG